MKQGSTVDFAGVGARDAGTKLEATNWRLPRVQLRAKQAVSRNRLSQSGEPPQNPMTTAQRLVSSACAWTVFCSAGRTAVDRATTMPALASRLPRLCRHVTAHGAPRWMAVTLMAPCWPHLGRPWAPKSGSKLRTAPPCLVRLSSQFSVANNWARALAAPLSFVSAPCCNTLWFRSEIPGPTETSWTSWTSWLWA